MEGTIIITPHATLGGFAAAFAALYAAHQVADHWVQTQTQADRKALPGWLGRLHCTAHVATYTLTAALALSTVYLATNTAPALWRPAVALSLSAVSHYIADRRTPLRRLALALGKSPAWVDHGGGLYLLDQAWHIGFLFLAALYAA